jgi:4-hydroxybenzoate polyprenyltransferase
VFAGLAQPAILLYAAAIMWTIGYDTIYAHQDKEDDALVGLKSTALKFGEKTKPWLVLFYGATLALLASSGILAGTGVIFLAGLALAAIHFIWQIATLDVGDPGNCLRRFRSNRDLGAIVFAALLADAMITL